MTTALLVMDVQVGIVARFGNPEELLDRVATAVDAARAAPGPRGHWRPRPNLPRYRSTVHVVPATTMPIPIASNSAPP